MSSSKPKYIILYLFIVVILVSCNTFQKKSSRDTAFDEVVGVHFLNGLEIANFQSQTVDEYGVIQLLVKNNTYNCLSISNDEVRMFSYVNGKWLNIPDLIVNESPNERLSLDSKAGLFPETIIATKPDFGFLYENQNPDNIRVLILAKLCETPDSNNVVIGGYIDLNISP
jgi:hypothetical protein